MTGTFEVIGDQIKVTFTYQAPADRVQETITDAAHWLFDHGYGDPEVEFGGLTNNQKLAIVDQSVKDGIINYAKTYRANAAADTARQTALVEAETVYIE